MMLKTELCRDSYWHLTPSGIRGRDPAKNKFGAF